ncbi:hypothetical protein ACHAWF_001838 [Thalassiosira exigua]
MRPIALVTGGTRGIGRGVAEVLAEDGHDLLLTYHSDREAADAFAEKLANDHGGSGPRVESVGGDISLSSTRDEIFRALDSMVEGSGGGRLAVLVHNAGQMVGITSGNAAGIEAGANFLDEEGKPGLLSLGDGSILDDHGRADFGVLRYYQRMYGEAFVDLCERSLVRMGSRSDEGGGGGTIIGVSSPGVNAHYYGPDPSYAMQGWGKSSMEYSMRIYASKAAGRGINVNVIVPGMTATEAWGRIAKNVGLDDEAEWVRGLADRRVPMKRLSTPRDVGKAVSFLCSESGKFVTGIVLPLDGGMHLKL